MRLEVLARAVHDLRFWLIRKLAGKAHVAINLQINEGSHVLTVPPDTQLFAYNVHIRGTTDLRTAISIQ